MVLGFFRFFVSIFKWLGLSTSLALFENQAQAQLCETSKKGKMISRKQRRKTK
jgi:hypothetical protein